MANRSLPGCMISLPRWPKTFPQGSRKQPAAFALLTRCCVMHKPIYTRAFSDLECARHVPVIRHHDHSPMSKGGGPYSGPRRRVFTFGVGGPVGSGKTALVERLCREFWPTYDLAVITNDIYTREDAEFLARRSEEHTSELQSR